MAKLNQGWGIPGRAKKAHYFKEGESISICGRWMYTGEREEDFDQSPDDCAQCTRKVARLREIPS